LYNQRFTTQGWGSRSCPIANENNSIGVRVVNAMIRNPLNWIESVVLVAGEGASKWNLIEHRMFSLISAN